jgi:hypothetical protein
MRQTVVVVDLDVEFEVDDDGVHADISRPTTISAAMHGDAFRSSKHRARALQC